MAQPPLLENGGEWTPLATTTIPLHLRRNLWDSCEYLYKDERNPCQHLKTKHAPGNGL